MILYAVITLVFAPLAWLAARELRLASTTKFVEDGSCRDIRHHEDIGFALLHFLMLLAPIVGFAISLFLTISELFA